ncbi:MAG: cbb3-type cytochrome oxidase subunit 3 [Rhizobiaceae bacterium]
MDYNTFRQFADSWGLLYLFIVFLGVIIYVFRPGSKEIAEKIAKIPLEEDKDNV